eukprot:m.251426 g.251426  ORF g.251426 m.251426 type:complete len:53 (+) comp26506_c0_seq2:2177-2335(+)
MCRHASVSISKGYAVKLWWLERTTFSGRWCVPEIDTSQSGLSQNYHLEYEST